MQSLKHRWESHEWMESLLHSTHTLLYLLRTAIDENHFNIILPHNVYIFIYINAHGVCDSTYIQTSRQQNDFFFQPVFVAFNFSFIQRYCYTCTHTHTQTHKCRRGEVHALARPPGWGKLCEEACILHTLFYSIIYLILINNARESPTPWASIAAETIEWSVRHHSPFNRRTLCLC